MVRPRADNYEERRQEILNSAASMFAEYGFEGSSISQIAKKCGFSKALLYHYYQSKEELLYSMLKSHCDLLVESANSAIEGTFDPREKLKLLGRELMKLYMDSRDKHIVLLNSLKSLNDDQQNEIKSLERRLVKIIKDILEELRPDLSEPVRSSLAMYFMGSMNWTYTWFNPQGAISAGEYADLATTTYLKGVELNEG